MTSARFLVWMLRHIQKTWTNGKITSLLIPEFRFFQELNPSKAQHSGMSNYAKDCKSTVIPGLYYRNAKTMIDWLCETFGFEKQLVVDGPNGVVMHSQLTFGNGMIMIGSAASGTASSVLIKHPGEIEVGETQLSLLVSDCTKLYAQAKKAGAKILSELKKKDFGGEGFSCSDPEGHIWHFTTYDPWQAPGT
jgi:uncharacterized glyoxalase superfamily protein PhnB